MTRRFAVCALIAFGLATAPYLAARQAAPAAGAQSPAAIPPLTQKLGVDPAISTGVLPNGLRYYVRANNTPEHRAELRLVVNAGSVLEDDTQRGFAHVVEHMAFEGTAHYPRASVIAFMQSLGMGFGPHLNAETTFDNTIYQLQVPTDKPGALWRALDILHDFAHDITFDPAAVTRERQIVTEEWRQGLGANQRILNQELPVLLQGSRYADRLPIGKMDAVQSVTADQLKAFYNDWYRPDLMAVIIAGDVDRDSIVKVIGENFGALKNPAPERKRQATPIPDLPGTRFVVASDREATTASVSSYVISPAGDGSTVGGYRRELIEQLFGEMMTVRFSEIARRPDPPFVVATAQRSLFVNGEQSSVVLAVVPDTGITRGLQAMMAEVQRVARDGFSPGELSRIKLDMTAVIDRATAQKNTRQSAAFAAEYIRAFTTGEALPSLEDEMALRRALLAGVTLADVNALAAAWSPDRNRTIAVATGQKAGVTIPDKAALAAALSAATAHPLPAYVDTAVSTSALLETPPATPGHIVNTETRGSGITEWTLSNGVRVVLKPTTVLEDEIVFQAYAFGGTSLASDADLVPAQTSAAIALEGGAGRLSMADLTKVLAGKVARADPLMQQTSEGLRGGSNRKDLESLMQLVYLRFTAPRADATMFKITQGQLRTLLANQASQPEVVLSQALVKLMTQDHPRARPITAATVDQMDMDRSLTFYKDRFADASGFTFIFVGSFDPEAMRPLAEKYLATLPATHRGETWKDEGIHFPAGVAETTVTKGVDPKAEVVLVFGGRAQTTMANNVELQALARVEQGRLFSLLRQQLGGTYGVSAAAVLQKVPSPEYRIEIKFACDPTRVAELTTRVFDDITALQQNGPSRGQVADVVLSLKRDFETNSQKNAWLLGEIAQAYQSSIDPGEVFALPDLYNQISPESVQAAASTYFDAAHYVKATLVPEKSH